MGQTKNFVLSAENTAWAEEIADKILKKMEKVEERNREAIPYMPHDGRYNNYNTPEMRGWWTNGFWAGIMWQLYAVTGNERYAETARFTEEVFDQCIEHYERLDHDMGFMWLHTAVADYRLTKNEKSRTRGLHVASIFSSRFNSNGNFIRAWNTWGPNDTVDKTGWAIIDCMMNVPLLHWASDETHDPRFREVAIRHTNTVMKEFIRPDGSSNHICCLDPMTGEMLDNPGGQGYESGSSWSRGQAWALYGFALSYRHTKDQKYLDAAKRVANYFIANLVRSDFLPLCDFRQPAEPVYYDSTAGACAACGFLEIAEHVGEYEKQLYIDAAMRVLKAMEANWCDWDPERDSILQMGTAAYHNRPAELHVPIIYGDYFFIEAVLRLLGKDFLIW